MIKTLLLAGLCLTPNIYASKPKEPPRRSLFQAICKVESNNNRNAIGDNGNAVGIVQIWKICVDDVNRIIGSEKYKYKDRLNVRKSQEMFCIYLTHYGNYYQKKTGRRATVAVLSAIWNSGPNGAEKLKTNKKVQAYVKKVKRVLASN